MPRGVYKRFIGRKQSEETKKRISDKLKKYYDSHKDAGIHRHTTFGRPWLFGNKWNVGKHCSEETKKKIGDAQRGEKSSNWKGGIFKYGYRLKKQEELAGRKKPNSCEICGGKEIICFDHCHNTGKFRGWICRRCNIAIGMTRDDINILNLMIEYLKK